jgi:MFS family permease
MFKNITRTVWIISIISLLNDFSSEMLYPIIPLYLKQIGYGSLIIGILEGMAECTAGLSKIYMGSLSDQFQKRLPFIQMGYALSILSRPLIGISNYMALIFSARAIDRAGKGIRTGARDALLAEEATPITKAQVFGLHRSMDTLGAVLGPLFALVFLYFYPEKYKLLFLISIIPGIFSIGFTFLIKEKKGLIQQPSKPQISFSENFSFYKKAPKSYLTILLFLIIFSLVNSSDLFLLLRAKESGVSESHLIGLYILFNLVYALFSYPIGKLADRYSKINIFLIGLVIYALVYFLFSTKLSHTTIIISFILYGLFYAFTNGIIKAILVETVPSENKGAAIGLYEGFNSIGLLVANLTTGFIWYQWGPEIAFISISFIVFVIAILIKINSKKLQAYQVKR